MDVNLQLVAENDTGQGLNIGVHDTDFTENFLSGAIQGYDPGQPSSFSNLSFTGNSEGRGIVATDIAAYLSSVSIPGSTVDDWADHLLGWDRDNFDDTHSQILSSISIASRLGC